MNETKQSKKISVGLVLSWIFGPIFALTGIALLFSEILPGIIMLIMSAVILPPINKLVDKKWNFHLSKGIKAIIIIVGLIVFGSTVDSSDNINQKEEQLNNVSGKNINNAENQEELIESEEPPVVKEKNIEQPTEDQTEDPITTQPEVTPTPEPKSTPPTNPKSEPTPTPEPEPTSNETVSQKNALRKAKDYLDYSAFSYGGLIDQLEYEQFSHADAIYGANNCGADWNEQAVKKAQSYMEYSGFSRGSLIEQLLYEKFTQAQAEYGANAVGL